jgi:hypothetical protein
MSNPDSRGDSLEHLRRKEGMRARMPVDANKLNA